MSTITVSMRGRSRSLHTGPALLLASAALLALVLIAGLVGRWSAPQASGTPGRDSIPASGPAPVEPGPGLSGPGTVDGLAPGGQLCLLGRPC